MNKKVSDLQENVVLNGESITGKLNYVTDFKDFSSNEDEQKGNFLVIKVEEATKGKTVTAELSESNSKGKVTLDEDGIIVARITSKTQTITITIENESKILKLNELELDVQSA